MIELVVLSGKGGAGKTTVAAAIAGLASESVLLADTDVDAPNLQILLAPSLLESRPFIGGAKAVVDQTRCTDCGVCANICAFESITETPDGVIVEECEGCGVCARFCPSGAIEMVEERCGTIFVSESRFGPMVHAELYPGADNSGKLVAAVRELARSRARACGCDLIIVDGPPGIGCPVISSVTGADLALVVADPSLSGLHDLDRTLELTRHFGIPTLICINRYNVWEEGVHKIEGIAGELPIVGRIREDATIDDAQRNKKTPIEYGSKASRDLSNLWTQIRQRMDL
jgi:MinD superfamily P-loop ATPase